MYYPSGNIVLILVLVISLQIVCAQIGRSCTTPNGESAKCKSIYDCKVLLDAVQTRNVIQVRFLRESQCGYQQDPLVCCGTKDNFASTSTEGDDPGSRSASRRGQNSRNTALPDRTSCGFQVTDRIFGGEETALQEFPWMALFEYKNTANKTKFACGGAVISKRYILTAAHCITGEITKKIGQLVNVRLGEWDIRQEVDCIEMEGFKICNKPPENLEIEEVLVHPDYDDRSKNRYGDIALVKVKRDITYTEFIRPICLPLPNETSAIGEVLYVAGWGKTESASINPVKLKVGVPIAERSRCTSVFRSAGITLTPTQICAGGEKGKDSCSGDSGGPLMRSTKTDSSQWYIEGVVSFGARCGTEGWPGIYTKVSHYLDWINKNVKE